MTMTSARGSGEKVAARDLDTGTEPVHPNDSE